MRYWCSVVFAWKYWVYFALLILALLVGLIMVITPGGTPAALIAALQGQGITITSLTIQGQFNSPVCSDDGTGGDTHSWGTFTNASGVYGIPGPGVVISTGKAWEYVDGVPGGGFQQGTALGPSSEPFPSCPNPPTAAQLALLKPLESNFPPTFNDCTEIIIQYALSPGRNMIGINCVYGSNEYPNFQGPGFADPCGIYVNGVNIAMAAGAILNVNNPAIGFLGGTILEGVINPGGNPLLQLSTSASAIGTIQIILADEGDSEFDSTVYLSNLSGISGPGAYQTANSGGLNMPPCIRSHAPVEQSRIAAVDWSELSRRMDAMRPEPLPETQWKERG